MKVILNQKLIKWVAASLLGHGKRWIMTEHDNFIFNLERKQARVKAAIKAYKMQYLVNEGIESGTSGRSVPTIKAKLLGSK